jgi:hypothetical protein
MTIQQRVRERRRRADRNEDVYVALTTMTSLQATIRFADAKVGALAAVASGTVLLLPEQAARSLAEAPFMAASQVYVALLTVAVAGAAGSGWHLMLALMPAISGPPAENRFAFPAIASKASGLPPADLGRVRTEAWEHVAVLAGIAMRKHRRVRASVRWTAVEVVAVALMYLGGFLPVHL